MYTLPTEFQIEDITLHIRERGDFRVILDCFSALQDSELAQEHRILTALFIFYEDFTTIDEVSQFPHIEEAITKMFAFFACNETTPATSQSELKLIDWNKDSQLVSSAVNKVAGKEIRAEAYIHWWTFMGYYSAIGESPLATIISIRKKILTGAKLEKEERKFRKDNPQYFIWDSKSVEQKGMEQLISDIWNGG